MSKTDPDARFIFVEGRVFERITSDDEHTIAIWHPLDGGVLTLRLSIVTEPTSLQLAAWIQHAMATTWSSTAEHATVYVRDLPTPAIEPLTTMRSTPTEAQALLGLPELSPADGDSVQLVWKSAAFALTARVSEGTLQIDGVLEEVYRSTWVTVETDTLGDLLVDCLAAEPAPGNARLAISTHHHRGTREVAAPLCRRFWETAWEHAPAGIAQDLLAAHPPTPHHLPRCMRARRAWLSGRWQTDALERQLATLDGPWVVDARGFDRTTPTRALRRMLRRTRTERVFVGDPMLLRHRLDPAIRVVEATADAPAVFDEGARELYDAALLALLRPEFIVVGGEALTHTDPTVRARAHEHMESWLTRDCTPVAVPPTGWTFTTHDEGFQVAVDRPGWVLRKRDAWVILPSARIVHARVV